MKERTYTPEEIQKKFDALPEDVKNIIYGADMLSVIKKVGETYRLHIDQLDVLEAETADVMTGYTNPGAFSSGLMGRLNVDKQTADKIAKDISDQLFVRIRESMKKMYEEGKKIDERPNVPTPTPSPVEQVKPAISTTSVPSPMPQIKLTPPLPAAAPAPLPKQALVSPPQQTSVPKPVAVTPADLALSQKTVSPPKPPQPTKPETPSTSSGQAKPAPYKADPYREPAE